MKNMLNQEKEEKGMQKSTVVKTRTRGCVLVDTRVLADHELLTRVFASDENGHVSRWVELDGDIHATKSYASKGHEEMVEKWKNM